MGAPAPAVEAAAPLSDADAMAVVEGSRTAGKAPLAAVQVQQCSCWFCTLFAQLNALLRALAVRGEPTVPHAMWRGTMLSHMPWGLRCSCSH